MTRQIAVTKEFGMRMNVLRSRLLGLALVVALPACSHQIPLNPSLPGDSGAPKIEESVGVYMSPAFKTHEHRDSQYGDTWIFPLGRASSELMDGALRRIFENTYPVDALPPNDAIPAKVSAVIEPRIEEFSFVLPFLKTGTYRADITYRFVFYRLDGTPFASWVVPGTGAKPGQIGFEFARWPGEAADLAMQDAARKLIREISQVPEIRRWLQDMQPQTSEAQTPWDEALAF